MKTNKEVWEKVVAFHGHECPGLAIGVKLYEAVLAQMKLERAKDEEFYCITENDACSVDAIQVLLGTTFGKGNLFFKDHGKQVYTVVNRGTNEAYRFYFNCQEKRDSKAEFLAYLLDTKGEELFDVKKVDSPLLEKAKIYKSYPCAICGESTSEHRLKNRNGELICLDCLAEE